MDFLTRVMGLEVEYGARSFVSNGRFRNWNQEDFPAVLIKALLGSLASRSGYWTKDQGRLWLINGSCFYVDTNHLEGNTPQCSGPRELARYAVALDALLIKALTALNGSQRQQGEAELVLFKDNGTPDLFSDSYGCHENFSFDAFRANLLEVAEKIAPFVITRNVTWGGSGFIGLDFKKRTGIFLKSQRAQHMKNLVSSKTLDNRGGVDIRDQSLTTNHDIKRLHVIEGDSLRLEPAQWFRAAVTSLVLQCVEEGGFDQLTLDLDSDQLSNRLHLANTDLSGNLKVWKVGRKTMSSLDIQRFYFDRVANHFGSSLTKDMKMVMEEWELLLSALEKSCWDLLQGRVEWVAKYCLHQEMIRSYFGYDSLPDMTFAELCKLADCDMKYNMLAPDSLYEIMKRKGLSECLFSAKEIKSAVTNPPAKTCARDRSRLIRFLLERKIDLEVEIEWHQAKVYNEVTKARTTYIFRGAPNRPLKFGEASVSTFNKKYS